jgi:hypothetical protein
MPLTIYTVNGYPHDFLITKIDAPLEECAYLLDFERKLKPLRWPLKYFGLTYAYVVPVVHLNERHGQAVIGIKSDDPHFPTIKKLWKQHAGAKSTRVLQQYSLIFAIADFATHFPNDC